MPSILLYATLLAQAAQSVSAAHPAYVPERVYDTRRGAFTDFEAMVADLTHADVVFAGETHGHPHTHRLEYALLDGLRRRQMRPTVSLEMFERDVQDAIDGYLEGRIDEGPFLRASRPWTRYATDYRPLVELAKKEGWKVIAANAPRRLAAEVAKAGRAALDRLDPADRALLGADVRCPRDAYFERFVKAMSGHAGGSEARKATPEEAERYYWSQCVKDETMAEAVAAAVERAGRSAGPVVHFNGAFHSDFAAGVVERTRRRLPGRRIAVLTFIPVADLDAPAPSGADLARADYLVYTLE